MEMNDMAAKGGSAPPAQGISMNGQPVSMNGQPATQSLPVAHATPTGPAMSSMAGAAGTAYPMHEQEKVGSKCCGCCCDMRRAVIILDAILMVLAALSLISLALPSDVRAETQYQNVDDDAVIDVLDEASTVTTIVSGVGVLCLGVALFGAIKYNIPMISFGIFYLLGQFIAIIVIGVVYTGKVNDAAKDDTDFNFPYPNWVGAAIGTALYIYPHAGLINEIRQGIMSEETYPREEYSCCCGPPGR